jgi:hypothetical protein
VNPSNAYAVTTISPVSANPGSVPRPSAESEWQAARRQLQTQIETLHERTFKWFATLPPEIRPIATGRRYPRIVNRIGDLWGHCEYTRLYFQSLLIDRRKGRKGFPPEVRQEIEALQRHYFVHLSGLPAILWNAVPLKVPRIPQQVFPRRPEPTVIEILAP